MPKFAAKSNTDIYFHMTNHYRKLQTVRSIVDTSPPAGYYEKAQIKRQSRPPSRADRYRTPTPNSASSRTSDRMYNILKYNGVTYTIVKHDCLNRDGRNSFRSQSLPPRPPTRRKPSDTPVNVNQQHQQYSTRAYSSSPSSRKNGTKKSRSARSNLSAPPTTPQQYVSSGTSNLERFKQERNGVHKDDPSQLNKSKPTPRERKQKKHDASFKEQLSDHDYLKFALRITEDIIRNDLYSNRDMRRVFNSHIEANRGRLDMDRMLQQIEIMCTELNMPSGDTENGNSIRKSHVENVHQNVKKSLTCICTSALNQNDVKLMDCECASTRQLPLQCSQHESDLFGVSNTDNDIETHFKSPITRSLSDNSLEPINESQENEDFSIINAVRKSEAFLQLPSLSIVTERTEPTTSGDSLDTKLNVNSNVESVSEFETVDILPGFENLENSFNSSSKSVKSISFKQGTVVAYLPNPASIHTMENEKVLMAPVLQHITSSSTIIDDLPLNAAAKPAQSLGNNVFWLVCSCKEACSSQLKSAPAVESQQNASPIPNQPSPRVPLTSSIPPTCSTKNDCPAFVNQNQLVQPIKSEPLKSSNQSCVPIPAPRCLSDSAQRTCSSKLLDAQPKTGLDKEKSSCDNSRNQIMHLTEKSCLKFRKPNNFDEEYVLVTGPVYVPKACIEPVNSEAESQKNVMSTIVTGPPFPFSKDAMVNTELSVRSSENSQQVSKASSPSSSGTTYSCLHAKALSTTHYTSFSSVVAEKPLVPTSSSLAEEKFLSKDFNKPAKILHCGDKNCISSVEQNFLWCAGTEYELKSPLPSPTAAAAAFEINDYDLTPQRDSNNTRNVFYNDELNKYNLLLGNEYEINNNRSSCYNNGLSQTIRKFFPNSSTQTQSSDWLLASSSVSKLSKDDLLADQGSAEMNFIDKDTQETEKVLEALNKHEILDEDVVHENSPSASESFKQESPLEGKLSSTSSEITLNELIKSQRPSDDVSNVSQMNSLVRADLESSNEAQEVDLVHNQPQMSVDEINELSNSLKVSLENMFMKEKSSISEPSRESSQEQLRVNMQVRQSLDEAFSEAQKQFSLKVNMKQWQSLEKAFSGSSRTSSGELEELKNPDRIRTSKSELNPSDGELDALSSLDQPPPDLSKHSSLMLTIKQVTSDLNRFRQTEQPIIEKNIPSPSEHLLSRSAESEPALPPPPQFTRTPRKSITQPMEAIPQIEISKSEVIDGKSKGSSKESVDTICCGLKKVISKKKSRVSEIAEVVDVANPPNISSVPEDNLFYINIDPRASNPRGSTLVKFSKEPDMDFLDEVNQESYLDDENIESMESDKEVNKVRNTVVTYRTPSMLPMNDNIHISRESLMGEEDYDDTLLTDDDAVNNDDEDTQNNDEQESVSHGSFLVEILAPPTEKLRSSESLQVLTTPSNSNVTENNETS